MKGPASAPERGAVPSPAPARPAARRASGDPIAWTPWLVLALLALALDARGLALGLIGDDVLVLESALRHPLGRLLAGEPSVLAGFRPFAREFHLWLWGRTLGFGPFALHVLNAMLFAAAVALLAWFVDRAAGRRAAVLAAALLIVFPPTAALWAWISAVQELWPLVLVLAALVLVQAGRTVWAGVAVAVAMLSNESALCAPLIVAAYVVTMDAGMPAGARLRRLAPTLVGAALAIGLAAAATLSWAPSVRREVWALLPAGELTRAPVEFVRAWFPSQTGAGLAAAWSTMPWAVLLVPVLALVAALIPAPARGRGTPVPAMHDAALARFGVLLLIAALIPAVVFRSQGRIAFFPLAALGASVALAPMLARLTPALAGLVLAALALVNVGANAVRPPTPKSGGAPPVARVSYALFRDADGVTGRMLSGLEPLVSSIRSRPRTFVTGLASDGLTQFVFGPGIRVLCRDTTQRVKFLADFTPADAPTDFGVIRQDSRTGAFEFSVASPGIRARIGEGFLIYARYDVAAACYEAAATAQPRNPDLAYTTVVALAAAGRGGEARLHWLAAQKNGVAFTPTALTDRMLLAMMFGGADTSGAPGGTSRAAVLPLAAAAVEKPWDAEPHRALGRYLLEHKGGRQATFELSVAAGLSRVNDDLAWLAQGYEAMGARQEALTAYQQSLAQGLSPALYERVKSRFVALSRELAPALDRPKPRP